MRRRLVAAMLVIAGLGSGVGVVAALGGRVPTLAAMTDGPLTPLAQLRGRTDENGYLRISVGVVGVTDGPLTPLGILRTRTDENGYLRVSCADCGGGGSPPFTLSANDGLATAGSSTLSANASGNGLVFTSALGSELTTNGGFTGSASGWTLGSGWAYGANAVTHTPGDNTSVTQAMSLAAGRSYQVTIVVSAATAGALYAYLSDSTALDYNDYFVYDGTAGAGTLTFTTIAFAETTTIWIDGDEDFDGTITAVSVKEIVPSPTVDALSAGHILLSGSDQWQTWRLSLESMFGSPSLLGESTLDGHVYRGQWQTAGGAGSMVFTSSRDGISRGWLLLDNALDFKAITTGPGEVHLAFIGGASDKHGALRPGDNSQVVDIGTSGLRFNDGWFDGTVTAATLAATTAFRDGSNYQLKWDTDALGVFANDGTTYTDIRAANFIMSNSSIRGDKTDGHAWTLEAWDVDGSTSRAFLTCTNGNTPTCALATPSGGSLTGDFATLAVATVPVVTTTGSQVLTNKTLTNPTVTQTPVAIGSLPSCGAGTANQVAIVNDALTPALGVAVSAGGALTVGVICKSGTGWLVF